MEATPLKESENEVAETLDANVYNPPHYVILPFISSRQWMMSSIVGETTSQLDTPVSTPNEPVIPHPEYPSYGLENFKENRMIIFNHEYFLEGKPRYGTLKDEEMLRKSFVNFRFTIETYKDLFKKELSNTIKNFAQSDFSRCGCICVVIMTHGHKEPGYLMAYDQQYHEREIFESFDVSKNPTLAEKPIIFIIQACRGQEASMKVDVGEKVPEKMNPDSNSGADSKEQNYHLPMEVNRVVFHSSYVGKASIRNTRTGSWFIQTLCQKINEYALTHDLEDIFRMVRQAVALNYKTDKDEKQMAVVTSTATKDIRLAPMIQPVYFPCCCFTEYFEYLKKCLVRFCAHNSDDHAIYILEKVEEMGHGTEYNFQKFDYIREMWKIFEKNKHNFPAEGFSLLHVVEERFLSGDRSPESGWWTVAEIQ